MQDLLKAVNHHAATDGISMNASKTKLMSAPIQGEQWRVIVIDGESLEDAWQIEVTQLDVSGQCPNDIRSRILSPAIPNLLVASNIVECIGQYVLGSGVLYFDLCMPAM